MKKAVAAVLLAAHEACGFALLEDAKKEEEEQYLADLDAAATIARSAEAIEALREAGSALAAAIRADEGHAAHAVLASKGKSKPSGKLLKSFKKPKGTMALIGEGSLMDTVSLGGFDLTDPAYVSGQFRDGGCTAVSVKVGPEELAADAVASTVAEQETARGEFPSPIPTIARGPFVDEVQLAAAAAGGAAAVILPLAVNGPERTGELLANAAEFGLEALVRVCTEDELKAALALEPSMLLFGDCNLEQASAMLPAVPEGIRVVADLPTPDVRGAWKVRDAGFAGLLAGRSMMEVCVRDRVPPAAVCKSILSKGSVKYGLGMQKGRLEGSKEFLGSLAM